MLRETEGIRCPRNDSLYAQVLDFKYIMTRAQRHGFTSTVSEEKIFPRTTGFDLLHGVRIHVTRVVDWRGMDVLGAAVT